MTDKLISGKELAALQKENIKKEVSRLNRQGIYPKLSVIIVGDNPRSLTYVKGKHKDCAECGIISENIEMPENVSQDRLLAEIARLNKDDSVHGILVQLPLPAHIDEYAVINAIGSDKAVGSQSLNKKSSQSVPKNIKAKVFTFKIFLFYV